MAVIKEYREEIDCKLRMLGDTVVVPGAISILRRSDCPNQAFQLPPPPAVAEQQQQQQTLFGLTGNEVCPSIDVKIPPPVEFQAPPWLDGPYETHHLPGFFSFLTPNTCTPLVRPGVQN